MLHDKGWCQSLAVLEDWAAGTVALAWNPTCGTAMWHLDRPCGEGGRADNGLQAQWDAASPSQPYIV